MVYFKYEYAPFDGLKTFLVRAVEFEPSTALFSNRSLRFSGEGFKTRLLISERASLRGGGVNFMSSVSQIQVKSGPRACRSPIAKFCYGANAICSGRQVEEWHNNNKNEEKKKEVQQHHDASS